jgi:hypothetical protein
MNHKIKYLKYKNKYLSLKNQLGGKYKIDEKNIHHILNSKYCLEDANGEFETLDLCNNYNSWKELYIELYYLLFEIKEIEPKIIKKIDSLCKLLLTRLELIYSTLTKEQQRTINYDIEFIINIISMLLNDNQFTSTITESIEDKSSASGITSIKDFNKKINLDSKTFYYMEDCYTDNLELFFEEYDRLLINKKSKFFFRSNLVNLSKLFKCYTDGCIEKITATEGFYFKLKNQITPEQFDVIFDNFGLIKKDLIKLLLESYKDFNYQKMKQLYIKYLQFYYENFQMLNLTEYQQSELENIFNKIIHIIQNSGNDYYVYLSCNIPKNYIFYRFELTRILTSFIGFRYNEDNLYNTIEIIDHDFYIHEQYDRKLSYIDKELLDLRDMFIQLYKYCQDNKEIFNKIVAFIHNYNYEIATDTKLSIDKIIQRIIKYICINNGSLAMIINFGISEFIKINSNKELSKLLELSKSTNFFHILTMNSLFKKKNIPDFTSHEKKLLIDSLITIFPSNFFDIIVDYINSTSRNDFQINLVNPNPDRLPSGIREALPDRLPSGIREALPDPKIISLYRYAITNKCCLEEFEEVFELVKFFRKYEPTKDNIDIQHLYINLSMI